MEKFINEIVRVVIVPVGIMFGGFGLEYLAIRSRGVRDGQYKFKIWLRRGQDNTLYSMQPKNIIELRKHAASSDDQLADVMELSSFEDYSGISFDLCIAAFTADVIALFGLSAIQGVSPRVGGAIAIHFLILVVVTVLVTANQRTTPNDPEIHLRIRTITAIVLGLFALATSMITIGYSL